MKKNLFQQYELDALLGEFAHEYDVDGIIEESTEVDGDGDRIWTAFGEDLYDIIERHDMHRTKAEFRAMRESLGLTQQRMADDLGVNVLSVKRWESPKYPQVAPGDAWELLDDLMALQDEAVETSLAQVKTTADGMGEEPLHVLLPYWSSQSDFLAHHYDAADTDASWTEVNATNRRLAIMLRWLGYGVRWVDGSDNPVPRVG